MELSKLEHVSTEALCAIRDKCAEILRSRSEGAVRRGAIGWFISDSGEKVFIRVDRINQKTLSGTRLNSETLVPIESNKWKVSRQMVTIMNTKPAPRPVVAPAYVPQSTGDALW